MAERPFSEDKYLVGRVRVDLSSITFQDEINPRLFDDSKVEKLLNIFKESSQGCEQDRLENHISAIISPVELDAVLQTSGLTRDDLRKSLLDGEHLTIIALNKIYCLNGRYRIKAAKEFLVNSSPHERYWTVALYLFELHDPNRTTFIRRKAEQYSHEEKYTDGEVYLNIRFYEGKGRDDLVQDWMFRSTESKQEDLSRLLQNSVLVNALDLLLPFLGLWDGLRLSYIRNILGLHCEEELVTYLNHIYRIWNQITLGSLVIQQAVNIQTGRNLHMRAPSSCLADRVYIAQEMDNGHLFPAIKDRNLRELIKREILSLQVMIPTIKSFHENLTYFEVGARILKSHLLNKKINTTLYQTMSSIWSPPENFMVEFQEGEFQRVILPAHEVPVRFFYKQLFLFVLRYKVNPIFPRGETNDFECAQGVVDRIFRVHLLKRAEVLGFRNRSVLREQENEDIPELFPTTGSSQDEQDSHGQSVDRRWGRPSRRDYERIRTQLFLPKVLRTSVEMSVLYVQRDFLNAFFGSTAEFTILAGRVIRLTQEVSATVPPLIPQSSNVGTESELELTSHNNVTHPETASGSISQGSMFLGDQFSGVLSTEQIMSQELRTSSISTSLGMNQLLFFSQSATENNLETPSTEARLGVGEEIEYRRSTTETEVARPISLVNPNNNRELVDNGVEAPRFFIDSDARPTTPGSRTDTAVGSLSNSLGEDIIETPRSFIDIDARSTIPDSRTDTAVRSLSNSLGEDIIETPRSFIDMGAGSMTPDSRTDTFAESQASLYFANNKRLNKHGAVTLRSFIGVDARQVYSPETEGATQSTRVFTNNNAGLIEDGAVTPRSFIDMNPELFSCPGTKGAAQSSLHITNDTALLGKYGLLSRRSFIPLDVSTTSKNTSASVSGIGPSHREKSRQGVICSGNSPAADTSSLYQRPLVASPSTSRTKNLRLQRKKILTSKSLRPLKLPKLVQERMYDQQSLLAHISQEKCISADSLNRESSLYHNNKASLADPLYDRRSNLGLGPKGLMAATEHYSFPSQSANRRRLPISVNSGRLISKKIRHS